MNNLDNLNSVLGDIGIKNYTVLGNKVIIKSDYFMDSNSEFFKLSILPFQFYIKSDFTTDCGIPNNFIPTFNLTVHDYKTMTYNKDINVIGSVYFYGLVDDSLCNIEASIKAKEIYLEYCTINNSLHAETIDIDHCNIKTNTIKCEDNLKLFYNSYDTDLIVVGCKVVELGLSHHMDNFIFLKDIDRLDIITYEVVNLSDRTRDKFKVELSNIKHLKLSNFSLLSLIDTPLYVDTLEISEYHIRELNMNKFPTKPIIVCNKFITYNTSHYNSALSFKKTFYKEYPSIINIEKLISIEGAN